MISPLASIGPSAYWYLARGTGAVALLLLTAGLVLGVLGSVRFSAPRWPRFAVDTLHRDISLLVMAVLVVHIITSVLDSFAPIALSAAVIPFGSSYRPLWLGLGALSFDLLIALVLTSLVRRRLGYRTWRLVHWLSYASWPIAVLHGLGTGSDTKVWWMLALTLGCLAAVVVAVGVRIGRAERPEIRMPAVAFSIATPVGLAVFTLAGPLAPHWAKRAGTPANLLPRTYVAVSRPGRGSPSTVHGVGALRPFSADLSGQMRQAAAPGGAVVDLSLRLLGVHPGRLRIRLAGAPIAGGGLSMTGSQVDLIANGASSVLAGQITSLNGSAFVARVQSTGGALDLRGQLNVDARTNSVTGHVDATPAGGGGGAAADHPVCRDCSPGSRAPGRR